MNQAPSQEHIHSYERPSVRPGAGASAPPPTTFQTQSAAQAAWSFRLLRDGQDRA